MSAKGSDAAVMLMAILLLASPGAAAAAELQSVLVRTDRDCWREFRQRALRDSGVTVVLASGKRLAARMWAFDGERRAIRLWLTQDADDSLGVRSAAGVLSFEYRKQVKKDAVARVIGVTAGIALGGIAGAASIRDPAGPDPLLNTVAAPVASIEKVFASALGALLGGTVGYLIGNALTPRVPRVEACECGEATPATAAAAMEE